MTALDSGRYHGLPYRAHNPVPTQPLADRLNAAGFAGMLAPNLAAGATSADSNLVLWRWNAGWSFRRERTCKECGQ